MNAENSGPTKLVQSTKASSNSGKYLSVKVVTLTSAGKKSLQAAVSQSNFKKK